MRRYKYGRRRGHVRTVTAILSQNTFGHGRGLSRAILLKHLIGILFGHALWIVSDTCLFAEMDQIRVGKHGVQIESEPLFAFVSVLVLFAY